MSKAKYVALDCETGGFEGTSLLTCYLVVLDEKLDKIDDSKDLLSGEFNINLKPDDGIYKVTAEALNINKIDLIKHDKTALTKSVVGQSLRRWLRYWSKDGANKLTPLGHNVAFDVNLIKEHILSTGEVNKYVRYRVLDTGVLACTFEAAGWVAPGALSGGLGSLVEYYNLPKGDAHTAYGDTWMTINVAKEMISCMKGVLRNSVFGDNDE